MARAVYLDGYSTVDITEEGLMALTSLLYYVTIYAAQSALFGHTIFNYSTLSDAFSTQPQRTRMTSATAFS